MIKQVLFIQGAGRGAYEEDRKLATSLQQTLGAEYVVRYPAMPDESNAPYEYWKQHIVQAIASMQGAIILVGHSVGASVLAKVVSEIEVGRPVSAIYLMATPFWGGEGWRYEGYEELELPQDVAAKFPRGAHLFLCHSRDDETVPFDHLAKLAKLFPHAHMRELDKGGHQLSNDLSIVAKDIRGHEWSAP